MAKFGINDLIDIKKKESKSETVNAYKEIWLNPRDVKPSESNFYSQENIEELADSFLAVGQQQPTVLARVDGEFCIVSGHRRNLANIRNLERGYREYEKVRYLYKDMTPAMLELSLLMGNAYNRELTGWEKSQQAKRLRRLYHKDRRKPFWTFIISFEEAQAFRKANGGYLRKNQWEDLTVDVYI